MVPSIRDIFISYSHDDSKWVKEVLLPKLESHGFSVVIDFRDFKTGSFGVDEMERGVLQTRRTLLVLSKSYLSSEWAKFENVMAQTSDPSAVKRKIIPILISDCDIPLRLKIITYRDLRNDDQEQWDLLIRDII